MSQNVPLGYIPAPSLTDGNLASRILMNPAGSVNGGHTVPDWTQLINHLKGLKYRIFELSQNATFVYRIIVEFNHRATEATVLFNRFLEDSEKTLDALNAISHRAPLDYFGPARDHKESQEIILGSSEATELFTAFLMENTISIQHLQEIHTQIQLAQKQQDKKA